MQLPFIENPIFRSHQSINLVRQINRIKLKSTMHSTRVRLNISPFMYTNFFFLILKCQTLYSFTHSRISNPKYGLIRSHEYDSLHNIFVSQATIHVFYYYHYSPFQFHATFQQRMELWQGVSNSNGFKDDRRTKCGVEDIRFFLTNIY